MIDERSLLLDARQSARQLRRAGVTGSLFLVAMAALPTIAFAQTPAPDATPPAGVAQPVPPDAVPPAPVPVPAPTPPPTDVLTHVQESDQRSRITDRRLDLLEEKLDKAAKESPSIGADEKGFLLRSADRRSFVQLRGLLQIDTRWFLGNDTVSNNVSFNDSDSILIRRFRPEIGGTLVGLADFLFSPDFAGAATTVFDAYIDVHPFPWLRLHVGKFKTPLGLERLQSEGAYPFIERALDQNLTPGRDIGAALQGDIAGGIVNYSVGVYDGFPDNANNSGGARPDGDTDHAKDFIGRLFFQPFKAPGLADLGSLGVGIAASTGNRKGLPGTPLTPTFTSAGQQTIFSFLPATATLSATFVHLRETHLNPQFFYYQGQVGVLAEYVWVKQGVQRQNATADLTHQAYHVSASYAFGGRPSYDGVIPDQSFDPATGHLGALEIAVRYDALKLDSDSFDRSTPTASYANGFANPTASVSKAQGWTGAVVYSPSRTLRFYLNFEQTFFKDGGAADATTKLPTDRKTENLLFARAHVKF